MNRTTNSSTQQYACWSCYNGFASPIRVTDSFHLRCETLYVCGVPRCNDLQPDFFRQYDWVHWLLPSMVGFAFHGTVTVKSWKKIVIVLNSSRKQMLRSYHIQFWQQHRSNYEYMSTHWVEELSHATDSSIFVNYDKFNINHLHFYFHKCMLWCLRLDIYLICTPLTESQSTHNDSGTENLGNVFVYDHGDCVVQYMF